MTVLKGWVPQSHIAQEMIAFREAVAVADRAGRGSRVVASLGRGVSLLTPESYRPRDGKRVPVHGGPAEPDSLVLMGLRLYDSATRGLRDFVPLVPGRVGMYICGATVQSSPHVGHMRTFLAFDVLRRWLERSGYEVTQIRNVTDIDDKILAKAAENGVPWWAWAYRYEQEFTAAYDALGLLRPTYEPRATGHVTEMVAFIARLVERGHAYAGDPGNVYFSVPSFPDYGSLTRQGGGGEPEGEEPGGDKRDPRDFALWKAPKPGEPETARWPTPWGAGRPGWHLECSAMAHRYLGETFDIHGGGLDLRFPHHENELAQSRAAGYGFVRYWMHSAWATMGGEKMSKSLGNTLQVATVLRTTPAPVVRLALLAAHYRSMVEYTDVTVGEAAANWERFTNFVLRAVEFVGEREGVDLPEAFVVAMDDDLNTPAAFAVIHEHVRLGNSALADGDRDGVRQELAAVRAMLAVLGLDPLAEPWREEGPSATVNEALDALVGQLLAERVSARMEKDWARADAIRDSLLDAGIVVEDSVGGARWHLKG